MKQEHGLAGKIVGRMIRNPVRSRFHSVYWRSETFIEPTSRYIFVCNHHGWHDGYLMFHLVNRLGVRCLDWIQEYESFPMFRYVGGMPFPPDNPGQRAATIRSTIRQMNSVGTSLVLFAEGHLHRPPNVLPFGNALEFMLRHVPDAVPVPVAIRYDMSIHERPDAYLLVGPQASCRTGTELREALECLLARCTPDSDWHVLVRGTCDINERWYARMLAKK